LFFIKNLYNLVSKMENKDIGVLLIHGFTGNLNTLAYIKSQFENFGYSVYAPSLTGHNTNYKDLENARFSDWLNDAEKGYNYLSKNVKELFVFGLSMGGALALHLQAKHKDIKGVILVNHALTIKKDLKITLVPLLKHFIRFVYDPHSDIKDKSKTNLAYEYTSVKAVHEFLKTMEFVRMELKDVTAPLLIFKSLEDHIIPYESVLITIKNVSSSEIHLFNLKNSYHVATEDFDKEIIFNKSVEFIEKIRRKDE